LINCFIQLNVYDHRICYRVRMDSKAYLNQEVLEKQSPSPC